MQKNAFFFGAFLLSTMSVPAFASPMSYGCDTPADRFSAIEQQVGLQSFAIKGSIQPNEFRKGKYAPLAQIYLESLDGKNRWAMKIIALGPKDKAALVFLETEQSGKKSEPFPVGAVKLGEKLPFEISVTQGSNLKFKIDGLDGSPEVSLGERANLNIICSTGDFIFSDLEWSDK
jgi:hypothetical protein